MVSTNQAATEAVKIHMPTKSRGSKIEALKYIRRAACCDLKTAMHSLDLALSRRDQPARADD